MVQYKEHFNTDVILFPKEVGDYIPSVKMRFKDELSVGNLKLSYDDLSKVVVNATQTKTNIIPLPFYTGRCRKKVVKEYIGVYIVGLIELLVLSEKRASDGDVLSYIYNALAEEVETLYENYEEIKHYQDLLCDDVILKDTKYGMDILGLLRTDYNGRAYTLFNRLIGVFYLIWIKDKRQFWRLYFGFLHNYTDIVPVLSENMTVDEYNSLINRLNNFGSGHKWRGETPKEIERARKQRCIVESVGIDGNNVSPIFSAKFDGKLPDEIKSLSDLYADVPAFEEERGLYSLSYNYTRDLHFKKISYVAPTGSKKYITDCRGIAISMTCMLWCYLLKENGFTARDTKYPFYEYKTDKQVDSFNKIINRCFGDDLQATVLRENKEIELVQNVRNVYSILGYKSYTLKDEKDVPYMRIRRDYYEDVELFKRAYGVKMKSIDVEGELLDFSVNYASTIFLNIAFAFIMTSAQLGKTDDAKKEIESLKRELDVKQKNLDVANKNLEAVNNELTELKKTNASKKEIDKLHKEIYERDNTIAVKNDIIDNLQKKEQSLSKKLADMIIEQNNKANNIETVSKDVSFEEKVETINDFSVCVIGGFENVEQKLREKGLTNITRVDNSTTVSNNSLKEMDFFVLCTDFVAHQLVYSFEKHYVNFSDVTVYFRGTNINNMVDELYNRIMEYLN